MYDSTWGDPFGPTPDDGKRTPPHGDPLLRAFGEYRHTAATARQEADDLAETARIAAEQLDHDVDAWLDVIDTDEFIRGERLA